MQKINFLTLSTIASLVLIGCGSSSTSTPSTANTGTGYYKDSAVAGVDYVCGTQTGKTDKEGKFTFEEGKECKFSLAGIPLRTTSADKLTDGGTILEDNPKVAKFLQSIDADGNLSNGIEIDDKVLDALTSALANIDDDTTVLSDETVLTAVVAEVGSQVEAVSGTVRTDSEVQAHLAQTQTEITKELLAGKTLYSAYNDNGTNKVERLIFNSDVTSVHWQQIMGGSESGNDTLTIEGDTLISHEDKGAERYKIVAVTDAYIKFEVPKDDGSIEINKLYFKEADAQQALEASTTDGGGESATLSDIVEKTVYEYCTDNKELFQMTLQDDGKIKMQGNVETEYVPYRIDGNTLYTTEDGKERDHTILEWTDKYIKFTSKEEYDDGTFYFTESDARANPQSDCGGGDETPANGITSGKVVFRDANNNTISVPSDAYIRITPKENQVEGNWNGLRCKIQSDGSFGSQECFIYGDYDEMKTLFNTSDSFQVVVFKNHIEPDEQNWDCGEDVYKYVGKGGASLWQNIEVVPSDYQDRSGESCNG